jgi:hypothetical protein
MTLEETEKLELGRKWLAHIDYDPEWSNDEFLSAVAAAKPSTEARAAMVFALRTTGEALIAEGYALISEAHTPELTAA